MFHWPYGVYLCRPNVYERWRGTRGESIKSNGTRRWIMCCCRPARIVKFSSGTWRRIRLFTRSAGCCKPSPNSGGGGKIGSISLRYVKESGEQLLSTLMSGSSLQISDFALTCIAFSPNSSIFAATSRQSHRYGSASTVHDCRNSLEKPLSLQGLYF